MRISYLALSDTQCTVQIPGCNFNCRGCFSNQWHNGGVEVSAARIAGHISPGNEVMLAGGGEPTLYRQGLLSLIHELDAQKVILSTNGYLLDRSLLENLGSITIHIDLKALGPLIEPPHPRHRQTTRTHLHALPTVHMPAAVRHPQFGDALHHARAQNSYIL